MNEICTDNRFDLIAKYKQDLLDGTNIETSPDEMVVIDNILSRFWQMGWLLPTPRTNGDHIRAMTDKEIENWYWWMHKKMTCYTDSHAFVHEWLNQEIQE